MIIIFITWLHISIVAYLYKKEQKNIIFRKEFFIYNIFYDIYVLCNYSLWWFSIIW